MPLTGAVAVIAVAATLVAVKGTATTTSAQKSTAPATATSAAPTIATSGGIPPYYVTLNNVSGASTMDAVLADTHTGKTLATFKPPANEIWQIATSASDSTFVLSASTWPATKTENTDFYAIHASSTDPQQSRLTKISLATSFADTGIAGAAVSADGAVLAVFTQKVTQTKNMQVNGGGTDKTIKEPIAIEAIIRTYSLATGQVLRAWTANGTRLPGGLAGSTGIGMSGVAFSSGSFSYNGNLQWLDDGQTLAWTSVTSSGEWEFETLNTANPGTSLTADSHAVGQIPGNDSDQTPVLTLDGKSVICVPRRQAVAGQPALVSYSVVTGKLEHVLYRFPATAKSSKSVQEWGNAVSWGDPSGAYVIGIFENTVVRDVVADGKVKMKLTNTKDIGVMTPTEFTPLPIAQTGANSGNGAFVAF